MYNIIKDYSLTFIAILINKAMRYRSRQYYKSKVLHNTEVTLFSTAQRSPESDYFDQNCRESRSPIHNASYGTFKPKIGPLYSPHQS